MTRGEPISPAEVREMREQTGEGLYECKRRDRTRVMRELTEDATTVADLKAVLLLMIKERGSE